MLPTGEVGLTDLTTMNGPERGEQQDGSAGGVRTACGWFYRRPRCLQWLAGPRWLLCTVSICLFVQSMAVNGLFDGSPASLMRRFELSSLQAALLLSGYDISVSLLIVFVGYLGNTMNKPRILSLGLIFVAVGNLLYALPHFIMGEHLYTTNNSSDVCTLSDGNSSDSGPHGTGNKPTTPALSDYLYVFILSEVLFAVGGSILYTLGYAFVDESVSSKMAGIYIGVLSICALLGPALGFVLAGSLLSIYTDVHSVTGSLGTDSSDVQWVDAWWLGVTLCAIATIIAIPLSCFPPELPDTHRIREERESQTYAKVDRSRKASREGFGKSWRDFPTALRLMIINPAFMFVTLTYAIDSFLVTALGFFLPIYLELQFGLSAGNANITVGALVCVAGGGSLFLGGWLIKRREMKVKKMLNFLMTTNVAHLATAFAVFLTCPEIPLAGVYQHYANNSAVVDVRLNDTCNERCHCSTTPYSPICGNNGVMYFSPCFAGCQGLDDGDETVYTDCACIKTYGTTNDSSLATAVPGQCGTYCAQMYIFLVFLFFIIATMFLDKVAGINIILRSVLDGQRSFALGVFGFIVRLFGSLPGLFMFGVLIDESCILWHEEGGERGQCWFYDRTNWRYYILEIIGLLKGMAFTFLTLGFSNYKPPQIAESHETEEETVDE